MKLLVLPPSSWKFLLTLVLFAVFTQSCEHQNEETPQLSQTDKDAIETLARNVPLILSKQGWDAYEATFSDNYVNWSMVGDQVRTREEYLGLVKNWYDQGNRATGSTLKTIDFIALKNNMVLYLYSLQERFNDPRDSTKTRVRDIRFVATYTKENGVWRNSFTAFMDKPNTQ